MDAITKSLFLFIKRYSKFISKTMILQVLEATYSEQKRLTECLQEIEAKRKIALQVNKYAKNKAVIMAQENYLYADNEFYKNRIRQCFAEHSRFMRNIGITP